MSHFRFDAHIVLLEDWKIVPRLTRQPLCVRLLNLKIMKVVRLMIVFGLFISLVGACSKWSKKMEVVRDCTGVYLKKDTKEYKVCNESKLDGIATGEKIKVDYDVLTECFGLITPPTCASSHSYENLIEVIRIK